MKCYTPARIGIGWCNSVLPSDGTRMNPLHKTPLIPALWVAAMSLQSAIAENLEVEYKPLKFGAVEEFGSINKMLLVSQPVQVLEGEWVDHFGAFFTQEARVNRRLDLKLGMVVSFISPR